MHHSIKFSSRCTIGELETDGNALTKRESKIVASQKMYEKILELVEDGGEYKNPFRTPKIKSESKPILENPTENKLPEQPARAISTQTENFQKSDPVTELTRRFISGDIAEVSFHVVSEFSIGDNHQVVICCSVGDIKENGTGNNRKTATALAATAILTRLKTDPLEKLEWENITEIVKIEPGSEIPKSLEFPEKVPETKNPEPKRLDGGRRGISAARNIPRPKESNSGASASARQGGWEPMNRPMRGNGFRPHDIRPNLENFRHKYGF